MPSIKYKKKTYAGTTFPFLDITKAQYDALPESKKMDGTIYMITDDTGGWEAENASYDNTESGLIATNVQDALDELAANEGSFKHIASGDLQNGGDTFTFDFSDSKYARKLFVLFVTGGVYLINIWYGSAQLFNILQTTSGTVVLNGKVLTVTVGQNLSILYGLYQVN